jgi:hypothetical protein
MRAGSYRRERLADLGQRRLSAAREYVEIEGDRLDTVVVPGRLDRLDHVAEPIFADPAAAAENLGRGRLGRLLDDRAAQVQEESAALARSDRRACRQAGITSMKIRTIPSLIPTSSFQTLPAKRISVSLISRDRANAPARGCKCGPAPPAARSGTQICLPPSLDLA